MKKQELQQAINKVKPAVADGKLIEFAGLLLFDGKKLVSYGDEISVSVPFETDFVAAVKADEFSKLINKVKTDELEIILEDNQLKIQSGKMEAGFTTAEYNKESVPDLGLSQVKKWHKFPEGFIDALKFAIFSASVIIYPNGVAPLHCLKVEPERILSSDNYRITEKDLKKKIAGIKDQLLIPRKIAQYLTGFNLQKMTMTESCAHYQDDTGVVFTHRLVSDEYPGVDEHLDVEGKEIELPKDLKDSLDAASVVAETVDISIEKGLVKVRGESENRWIEYPVDSDYKGEKLTFRTSPEHLWQILSHSRNVVVGENALLFRSDDFLHVVALISEDE